MMLEDERIRRAEHLLQDELLIEVLDSVKAEAINAWIQTGADDAAKREFAWVLVKAQGRIREVLQGIVDNGLIMAKRAAQEPLR
jgi:hypothetical protein